MTLKTVIKNLNNTIDGKIKLANDLLAKNDLINNIVVKFLTIDIKQLQDIRDDLNTLLKENKI